MPTPGSIVRCRERDWVLLPGSDDDHSRLVHALHLLVLSGTGSGHCRIVKRSRAIALPQQMGSIWGGAGA